MPNKTTKSKKTPTEKPNKKETNVKVANLPSYCGLPPITPRAFAPEVSPWRAKMILLTIKKWINGSKLKYYFFDSKKDNSPISWSAANPQKEVVRNAFGAWKNIGIGLVFEETTDRHDAQIRIGFDSNDGSWSLLGTDVVDVERSPDQRTMNFGWDLTRDSYGFDTALHEIGHTLGFPHEHQNPNAGIVWDEPEVYRRFSRAPNSWEQETIFYNIIRKLDKNEVEGSTHDSNSVMHYQLPAGLILSPPQFKDGIKPAGGLSQFDIEYTKKFYPLITESDYLELSTSKSQSLNLKPSEQKNFLFKVNISRKYRIETLGAMDTLLVLFEKTADEDIFLAADDDSGTNLNSKIEVRLIRGREYIIRVRLYCAQEDGVGALVIN
jgi:hypothetical protein